MFNKSFHIFFLLFTISTALCAQMDPLKTTYVVAQDRTGDYNSIQEAVNAVRDHMQVRFTIRVKAGTYHEKLVIPAWKKNIAIIGESRENTIISNADYSGKAFPNKDFTGNTKYSTYTSYTVLVQGSDCVLENLTVENTAGRVGQAVALAVEADRFAAKNCAFLGNQDTLYTSKDGKNYFESCVIAGTTDFIFGEATAIFNKCIIKSLSNSYITAASTTKQQQFGYVFFDCTLIAAPDVKKVYLGRPWRPYAKTVFIRCTLGEHIVPEGWNPWDGDVLFGDKSKTVFYAEYQNIGPGASIVNRVPWSKQLTSKQAKAYTFKNIFGEWVPNFKVYP
ncbi:pectinesterase family protein [Pedobacter sp. Du54]|uniref:pectinesterase family protein n=1 Tax=Pedobacter anseongensis TaxID=3133439 RepID=UPI0030B500D5